MHGSKLYNKQHNQVPIAPQAQLLDIHIACLYYFVHFL